MNLSKLLEAFDELFEREGFQVDTMCGEHIRVVPIDEALGVLETIHSETSDEIVKLEAAVALLERRAEKDKQTIERLRTRVLELSVQVELLSLDATIEHWEENNGTKEG